MDIDGSIAITVDKPAENAQMRRKMCDGTHDSTSILALTRKCFTAGRKKWSSTFNVPLSW